MPTIGLRDLAALLRESAGETITTEVGQDMLDTLFADLGYDSLAMLETAALVERRYGVPLSDETVAAADTPRTFLTVVNEVLDAQA